MSDRPAISDHAVKAYGDAVVAFVAQAAQGGVACTSDDAIRAGLAAAAPHIAAQALRQAASAPTGGCRCEHDGPCGCTCCPTP